MIKAVIFDWSGVIAPNPQGGWLNILADKLGISLEQALPHWNEAGYLELSKGIITEAEFWEKFEASYGLPVPGDKNQIWLKGSALEPWQGVLDLISELKTRGIKVAILSNTVKPMSKLAYEAKLYDPFDVVVLSDEVGLAKPDEEIYKLTLEKLSENSNECIYVDDLAKNLVAADKLGMRTLHATDDYRKTIHDIKYLLT